MVAGSALPYLAACTSLYPSSLKICCLFFFHFADPYGNIIFFLLPMLTVVMMASALPKPTDQLFNQSFRLLPLRCRNFLLLYLVSYPPRYQRLVDKRNPRQAVTPGEGLSKEGKINGFVHSLRFNHIIKSVCHSMSFLNLSVLQHGSGVCVSSCIPS